MKRYLYTFTSMLLSISYAHASIDPIPLTFEKIPHGAFMMEDHHKVSISLDFEIQTTTMTQGQYYDLSDGIEYPDQKENCPDDYDEQKSLCTNYPATSDSWEELQWFLQRLNIKNDGFTYRLPTEAEWEYAERAGSTTRYFFGDSAKELGDYAWYRANSQERTHAVGEKKPNAFGLYDMVGNVSQWTSDWYGPFTKGAAADPHGPATGTLRVIRGGSAHDHRRQMRSSYRTGFDPSKYAPIGFRLVRTKRSGPVSECPLQEGRFRSESDGFATAYSVNCDKINGQIKIVAHVGACTGFMFDDFGDGIWQDAGKTNSCGLAGDLFVISDSEFRIMWDGWGIATYKYSP